MDHLAWLKDDSEFPPLGSTGVNDWQDYVLVAHDDDKDWEQVGIATWADIVNKNTPAHAEVEKTRFTRPRPHSYHHHQKINPPEVIETTLYDLAQTQKSRARRRYRGDSWIHQHRVRVLTRIGYGSSIQGYVYDEQIESGLLPFYFVPPVHYPSFIHCWRYVCKEDPEPEVDRLRKNKVRLLLDLTS